MQKVIAATTAQTIVFPANEIEGANVIAYEIALSGGADIADVDRVRVLASGDIIVDVPAAFLRTFTEALFKTGAVLATTATRLFIPLYLPDLPTRDQRDSCQFPLGSQPQVEIDLLATVPAGAAIIGWTKSNVPPRAVSRLYSSVMNISASQDNGRFNLADGGVVRGVVMNTVGVSRARLVISDTEAFRLSGPQYLGGTWGSLLDLPRMNESPQTIADPFFEPVTLGIPAASGSSYVELDTGAAWAGLTNELGVWAVTPTMPEGAAMMANGYGNGGY